MYDDIWELLDICQDLLVVCQKLIKTERNLNKEEIQRLNDKLRNYKANDVLAGVLKND